MADLNLDKSSVGVGVRMHSIRSTFARLDVAHGAEGWRVIFNTSAQMDSTGGNEKLQGVAEFVRGGEHIMAHENVLARMSEPPAGTTKPPRPSDASSSFTWRTPTPTATA